MSKESHICSTDSKGKETGKQTISVKEDECEDGSGCYRTTEERNRFLSLGFSFIVTPKLSLEGCISVRHR